MESVFGFDNMAKEVVVAGMIQAYEKDIREAARVSHLLKQSRPVRPAWYCPVLVHLGEVMVSLGSRLKNHYSLNRTLRVQQPG